MTESTVKAYNQQANEYESKWQKYLAHTHDAFLHRIETNAADRIIDVSGGTGLLAKQIIERGYSFEHFIINDPSDQMLAIARERLSDNPKIDFANFRAGQLPYDTNYFDRIFCLNSFHFYKHQQQVLHRFHEILKPGGKFYLLDWNRAGFFKIVNKIIKFSSNEFIDTRSLTELRGMIQTSGFILHRSESWNWRYWKFLFIEGCKS